MKSTLSKMALMLAAGGALLAGATGFSPVLAAEDTTAAEAPPPGPPGAGPHAWGHGGPEGPMHLYSRLGLTADQQASLKAIMTAAKPRMKNLHEQMHSNQLKEMPPWSPR